MSIVASLQGRQSAKPQGFLITPCDPEASPRKTAPRPPASPDKSAPLVTSPSPCTASRAPPPAAAARMPTPAATPTKRTPARKANTPSTTPVRSTRSSGKPDHYKPLEGAPTDTPSRRKPAGSPSKRQRVVDTDTDSDDELMIEPRTPVKRTPTKRAASSTKASPPKPPKVQLPSPAPEPDHVVADSEEGEDTTQAVLERAALSDPQDEHVPTALSPPPRERAQRIAVLPLPSTSAPVTDMPSKARPTAAPRTVTPLKKRTRRAAADEGVDEDVFGPVASTSTPTKSATRTPATTPRRSPSKTVTPSRSSSRIQRLPASVAEIANAPANLRSRLVGFHMEDDGYGAEVLRSQADERDSDEEEDEHEHAAERAVEEDEVEAARRRAKKGKGRALMMEEDELENHDMLGAGEQDDDDLTLPEPPSHFHQAAQATPSFLPANDSSYVSSPLAIHLASTLALLTGARLPRPFLAPDAASTLPPRDIGLLGLPYLEGGFDEWERPLRSALDECVTKGMGNAVMLLGPRGVGKTMLVERTIALLSHVHGADSFVTVRLSGLVHTTDRLALRSIAVQLQEQGFGTAGLFADEGDYSSNSATMSTLLRLFEPSSASTASSTGAKASSSSSSSQPLVLIVDEFDLFAAHPRQSFLYCLLDIVQGNRRSGGFAVVGVSARVDCLSLLEKRVRSRCQSHVLQVVPRSSFEALCAMAARMLKADVRAWELVRGEEGAAWARGWNDEVERFLKEKKVVEYLSRLWSIHGNVPTELRSALSHLCYRLDSHSRLYGVGQGVPRLSFDLLKPPPRTDDKARDDVLKHLSIPQLTALISAKHLSTSTLDRQAGFNFEMVYDGYLSHVRRVAASTATGSGGGNLRALSKPALREAFDALRARELVLPRASSGSGGGALTAGTGLPVSVPGVAYRAPTQRDPWRMYRLTTWAKDVDREVEARGAECPLALRRWCKNWLD
ncbi:hypothetical protein JCM3775_000504 [Rhodotorula graminis]